MNFKHIFGPVPSRRLGLSLGIDLVPYKTCNLNCIYCECGRTTCLTNRRDEYIDSKEIIDEIKSFLKSRRELDYITFSGAGEPLLNSKIGEIADFLKTNYPKYKLALLTNGILISDNKVVKELKNIDLVIPSLDAGSEKVFKRINRPCGSVRFNEYVESLRKFSKIFENEIWLEVFLIKGINDSEKELKLMKQIIDNIELSKIQLNTIDRPTAESGLTGLNHDEMLKAESVFGDKAEIIGNFAGEKVFKGDNMTTVINCLKRRPLTVKDIADITFLHVNEINKILGNLEEQGKLISMKEERGLFFKLIK